LALGNAGPSTLAAGLVAWVYYVFTVSVNLALAEQLAASDVAMMNEMNERIENPLFFASFLGVILFLLVELAARYRMPS
jgi:uncharacterized membrane protein